MKCPECKKEIDRVVLITESKQLASLKGYKLDRYMQVQQLSNIIKRIECSKCDKDIQKFIVGFPK